MIISVIHIQTYGVGYKFIALMLFVAPDPDVFSCEGQRQHKTYFLTEYVPKDVEVVLIGHSIGAQVVLDIMDRIPADRVKESMYIMWSLN